MRRPQRRLVAAASVCSLSVAVTAALVLHPAGARWLYVPGLVAIGLSISSVVAEPRELSAALLFGAAPLMGLAGDDAFGWMIGPLAVLLLIGCELNAWSWELGGTGSTPHGPQRLVRILALAGLGLVASLAVSVAARLTLLDGLVAVALAAGGLAGLGWVILPGSRRRSYGQE